MLARLVFTLVGLLLLASGPAHSQNGWPTPNGGPGAQGVVFMCLNGSGQAIPSTSSGTCLGAGGGGGGTTSVTATAAAPSYSEGSDTNPLSTNLTGDLRTIAKQSGTWTVQPGNTANTTAWLVTGTGGTFPVTGTFWQATQPVSLVSVPSHAVTNAGTFATQATQAGTWTNTVTQATGSNLHMVCDSGCSGSGGTSSNYGSAFPSAGTAIGMSDGTNMVALRSTTYGTTPTGLNALAVNAFVTNTNANGVATAANSSPVVQALDLAAPLGNIAANNTTAVVVNAAATTVYSIQLSGIGSAPAYLKLYNATSATCGSGTPVKRLMIPAASTAANGAGSNITFPVGVRFSTGLTYCITTGITDADTSAPAASTFLVNIDWH